MADDSERRRDLRGPIELKVEYNRLNAFFADYTRNISKDGTFIKTSKPLDIGTEFVFKLFIPTMDAPLEISGEVRWILTEEDVADPADDRDAGMGIRFIYHDNSERRRLHQMVEKLMTDSLGTNVYQRLMDESGANPTGGGGK